MVRQNYGESLPRLLWSALVRILTDAACADIAGKLGFTVLAAEVSSTAMVADRTATSAVKAAVLIVVAAISGKERRI